MPTYSVHAVVRDKTLLGMEKIKGTKQDFGLQALRAPAGPAFRIEPAMCVQAYEPLTTGKAVDQFVEHYKSAP